MNILKRFSQENNLSLVFWLALVMSLIVVFLGVIIPNDFKIFTENIRQYISATFGWYYLLLVTSIVCVCFFLILTPMGQIRLGNPGSKPEHSNLSWIAMLFSAGMGIGLVFWGAAEPLSHYAIHPATAEAGSSQALEESIKYTFFHWGIHAWAIYAIVALSIAYFRFRKKEKILLSSTLKPLFGKKMNGICGQIVDSITIFATIIGVATTLGFGAAQINGGLTYLFGIPNNIFIQFIIIIITTILFIISAISGLGKGVKILSNVNMILAIGLLALVIALGPTILIMDSLVDGIGNYLSSFFRMSFRASAIFPTKREWTDAWTIFYWAWWISWSPFVGVFIARISKGRTIKEFLSYVLLIPTLLSFLWFSTFGTLATNMQSSGIDLTYLKPEEVLFGIFNHVHFGMYLSIIAIILVGSFFITSADSATFVLGMLSEDGTLNPKNSTKMIWGILLSLIAIILLSAGGLIALQNFLIIVAFLFSFILILMVIALIKELKYERDNMGLYIRPRRFPGEDAPFKSYEDDHYKFHYK